MFSIVVDVHRNILSAQCYVKYEVKKTYINNMQIIGTDNHLLVSFFRDDELQREVKIVMPINFFLPTSVSGSENSTSLIELDREMFTISQKSHYSKYRKVIERHLDVMQSETSTFAINYKRFKSNNIETNIQDQSNSLSEVQEIDYSQHVIPIEDIVEVNFRVQVSDSDRIPINNNVSIMTLYEFFKTQIAINSLYEVVCSKCNNLISTNPLCFEYIKEYCSSYTDSAESWFCHKNISFHCNVSNKTLYIGDAYIYLHSSIVKLFSVNACGNELKCKTCNVILTSNTVSVNKGEQLQCFFADAIILKKSDTLFVFNDTFNFKIILMSLLTIIKQKSLPICRLFFQSKGEDNKDTCLLMRIPTSEIAQFKFHAAVEDLPTQIDFSVEPIFKVQYHVGSLSSPLVENWSKDFGVDFYKVSDSFIQKIIHALKTSTECISGGKNKNGFSSGCLPSDLSCFIKT